MLKVIINRFEFDNKFLDILQQCVGSNESGSLKNVIEKEKWSAEFGCGREIELEKWLIRIGKQFDMQFTCVRNGKTVQQFVRNQKKN